MSSDPNNLHARLVEDADPASDEVQAEARRTLEKLMVEARKLVVEMRRRCASTASTTAKPPEPPASIRARAPDGAIDIAKGHRSLRAAHAARTTTPSAVSAARVRLASREQHGKRKHHHDTHAFSPIMSAFARRRKAAKRR